MAATPRSAYLHIGLPHSGGARLDAALHEHAEHLAAHGVRVPATSVDESFRAAVEIRRDHKAWGLRRRDVEGTWARICRRVGSGRDTVVAGHPLLAGATAAEIDLLVDRLPGVAIHVVITVAAPDARVSAFPDDHDLVEVLARWERAVCSPDRLHVVVCDPADPVPAWLQLGDLLGVDTTGLALPPAAHAPVDLQVVRLIAEGSGALADDDDLVGVVERWAKAVADAGHDVRGDLDGLLPTTTATAAAPGAARLDAVTDALSEALAEVSRLRARTRELERAHDRLTRKKRKLKGLLARTADPSAGGSAAM